MAKVLQPILNVETNQWMLGYIEDHQARPLTREEIDEVIKLIDSLQVELGDLQEQDRHSKLMWEQSQKAVERLKKAVSLLNSMLACGEKHSPESRRVVSHALGIGTKAHEDSGEYCTVGHMDGKGNTLESCIRCKHCNQWIRPENMEDRCEAAQSD